MSRRLLALAFLVIATHAVVAADPLPIRREIIIGPALADFERRQTGPLVRMPRERFEERVNRAAEALARPPVQLNAATYSARLDDGCLHGEAAWTIHSDSASAAIFAIEPWTPAIHSARWQDDRPAMIAPFDSASPAMQLLVEKPEVKSLRLQWSLQSQRKGPEMAFDLRRPPCAVAQFELDLPVGFEPTIPVTIGTMSGPTPTSDPARRLWIMHAGGQSQVPLVIRPSTIVPAKSAAFVAQRNSAWLHGETAELQYEFDIDFPVSRQGQAELRLPRELTVLDVVGPNVARWAFTSIETDPEQRLQIDFVRPIETTALRLRGVMTLSRGAQTWVCPEVAVVGGVGRGEQLTIRVASELMLEDWRPGGMRIVDSRFEPNGEQVIQLASQWFKSDASRPSGRLRFAQDDWRLSVHTSWRVEAARQTVAAELFITPRRGRLDTIDLLLPTNLEMERLDSFDVGGARWTVLPIANNRRPLRVLFHQPLTPGQSHRIVVSLRGALSSQRVNFPSIVPGTPGQLADARLQIRVAPFWNSLALPNPNVERDAVPNGSGADLPPRDVFRSQVGALDGQLILERHPFPLTVVGQGRATWGDRGSQWDYRLQIESPNSPLSSVMLRTAEAHERSRTWRCGNPGVRVRKTARVDEVLQSARVGALAGSPWEAVAAALTPAPGAAWIVQLDRPVSEPLLLRLQSEGGVASPCRAVAALALGPWAECLNGVDLLADRRVPLWVVPDAAQQQHDWIVDHELLGAGFTATGLEEIASEEGRRFRHFDRLAEMQLARQPERLATAFGSAGMQVAVDDDGLNCRVEARVRRIGAGMVRVALPTGARWVGASIGTITLPFQRASERDGHLSLPVDARDQVLALNYRLPAATGRLWSRYTVEPPSLDGQLIDTPITWLVGEGVIPLSGTPNVTRSHREWSRSMPPSPHTSSFVTRGHELWAIDASAAAVVGWMLPFFAGALLLRRGVHRGAVIPFAFGVLAWIWLPPALQSIVVGWACVWGIALLIALLRGAAGRAAALLLVVFAWPSEAGGPEPVVVAIVPADDSAPEIALAPEELLKRLEAAERRGQPTAPAVLVAAQYVGKVEDSALRIDARWDVVSLRDGAALSVPITAAQLQDVRINDVAAFPKLAGGAYRFMLGKAGRATLTARWTVPVTAEDSRRLARLELPRIAMSRLEVSLPDGAVWITPVSSRGAATIAAGKLSCDLGDSSSAELRWRTAESSPDLAPPRIREYFQWNLANPVAILNGRVRCEFADVGRHRLQFVVPNGLEIAGIDAGDSARLVDWRLVDGTAGRLLNVNVVTHASPRATLDMRFSPTEPINTAAALPYPAVVGASEAWLAWSGDADKSDKSSSIVAVNAAPADLVQHPADAARPVHVFRRLYAAPSIRVKPPAEPTWSGDQTIRWRLARQRAFVEVTASVSVPAPRSMIEWETPAAVTVTAVEGEGVVSWSHGGTRLQVWFDHPRAEARLTWFGHIARTGAGASLELPTIRLVNGASESTVEVTGRPGWVLKPAAAQNLVVDPASRPGWRWNYRAKPSYYRAAFQVANAAAQTEFDLKTVVQTAQAATTITVRVEAQARQGSPAPYRLRVRIRPDDLVHVEHGGAFGVEDNPSPGYRSWLVIPGAGERHRFEVSVTMAAFVENRLDLGGMTIDCGDVVPARLTRTVEVSPNLVVRHAKHAHPTEPGRWLIDDDDWHLALEPAARDIVPVQVHLIDSRAVRMEDGSWQIRSVAWIVCDRAVDITLKLTEPSLITHFDLDGRMLSTPVEPVQHWRVPLAGPSNAHRMSWTNHVADASTGPATLWIADRSVVPLTQLWSQEVSGFPAIGEPMSLSPAEAEQIRHEAITRAFGDGPRPPDRDLEGDRLGTGRIVTTTTVSQIPTSRGPIFLTETTARLAISLVLVLLVGAFLVVSRGART